MSMVVVWARKMCDGGGGGWVVCGGACRERVERRMADGRMEVDGRKELLALLQAQPLSEPRSAGTEATSCAHVTLTRAEPPST